MKKAHYKSQSTHKTQSVNSISFVSTSIALISAHRHWTNLW